MNELTQLVSQVKNPISGLTLESESRIVSVEFKGEDLHVKYKRDGISPNDKKLLEKEMVNSLKEKVSEDNIFILAQSSASQDVLAPAGQEVPKNVKPAALKAGHGTIGEKKRIIGAKHVICIGSGKGGVGKSTYTANLGVTLANKGYKVGIIDADIYGPSLPTMFKRQDHKPQANDDNKIIPLENYGVKFISFGNFIHEDEPVVWRGPMLGGVLNQFFFDTQWGGLDYLLIDLPPGTGDVQLSMIQNIEVDGAIIISTPQDIALLDSRKALHMFDKMGLHVIGMVENMSSFVCDDCGKEHFLYGTGGVMRACNELGVGLLGKIPMDLALRKGADFGTPYMWSEDKHKGQKVWDSYTSMATRLDSYFNPSDNKKKSLLSKILKRD